MSPRSLNRRSARGPRGQRGFTLLEVVAAFAVLALGLGLAMQGLSGSMQQSRQAAEHTRAALYAQSVLDTLGVGEPLEEGAYEGEFADGYAWRAEVTPYEVAIEGLPEGVDLNLTPVELLRVDLLVTWPRGDRQVEARFATLRAMLPAQP